MLNDALVDTLGIPLRIHGGHLIQLRRCSLAMLIEYKKIADKLHVLGIIFKYHSNHLQSL